MIPVVLHEKTNQLRCNFEIYESTELKFTNIFSEANWYL